MADSCTYGEAVTELLAEYDAHLRTAAEVQGATDVQRRGPLWIARLGGDRLFVTYNALDDAAARVAEVAALLAEPGGAAAEIAAAHGATTGQVALAWLLRRSPVMLPIPGTGSLAHLEENVAAAELRLSEEEAARLDAAGA